MQKKEFIPHGVCAQKISFDYEAGTRELYNVDGMEIRKAEQLAKDGKYNGDYSGENFEISLRRTE